MISGKVPVSDDALWVRPAAGLAAHRALAGLLDEPDSSPEGDPTGALQLLPSLYYTL